MWKEERDAHALAGIEKIYLVREPGKGGDQMMRSLGKSAIRHRTHIVDLGEHKDPSGLYLADPPRFANRLHEALALAVPFMQLQAEEQAQDAGHALEHCRTLANTPDILAAFRDSVRKMGVTGENRNACVLFLALVSRLTSKPVSIAYKGPSSTGKSYVVDRVLDHMPDAAYLQFTGTSERGLYYLEDEIAHRHLIFAEAAGAAGEMQSYILRTLLSEGKLRYQMVDKTAQGMKGRMIEKEGPTGLILTTTQIRVHEENETRLLSITSNDTREQTRAIMRSIARRAAEFDLPLEWKALQTWLAHGERRVAVPFLPALAELASESAVRMRRDFSVVKSLIEAHALLHRATRDHDEDGNILATLTDYHAVRTLVADLIGEGHASTVKPEVREAVEAVALLTSDGAPATLKDIAQILQLDLGAASRRCLVALRSGFIVNEETLRGKKARYVLGDPMPTDDAVLPTRTELADAYAKMEQEESETTGEERGEGSPTPPIPPALLRHSRPKTKAVKQVNRRGTAPPPPSPFPMSPGRKPSATSSKKWRRGWSSTSCCHERKQNGSRELP